MDFVVGVGKLGAVGQNLRRPLEVRLIRKAITSGGIYPRFVVFAGCEPFSTDIFFRKVSDRFIVERIKSFASRVWAYILGW